MRITQAAGGRRGLLRGPARFRACAKECAICALVTPRQNSQRSGDPIDPIDPIDRSVAARTATACAAWRRTSTNGAPTGTASTITPPHRLCCQPGRWPVCAGQAGAAPGGTQSSSLESPPDPACHRDTGTTTTVSASTQTPDIVQSGQNHCRSCRLLRRFPLWYDTRPMYRLQPPGDDMESHSPLPLLRTPQGW